MEKQIACLVAACRRLGLAYELLDREGNFVRVGIGERWEYFQLSRTPFNSEVIHGICRDKMHTYQALSGAVNMPRTLSFLDLELEPKYRHYLELESLDAILERIERALTYPLVVKRNRGYLGIHVYLCPDRGAAETALRRIFDQRSKHYDYLALAQEFVATGEEFRLVCAYGTPVLTYRRGKGRLFNLRYWENDRHGAHVVEDPALEQELLAFVEPVQAILRPGFVGFDIIRSRAGRLYLIELNSSPRFDHVIEGSGETCVIEMYARTLSLYREMQRL
jgi:glutathione synthase/RimK-type ligase-like ATP-grasp enzyme